ncbi:hypothetical protein HYT92_00030 [Candidatus Pacearchaeota archaeon]|nr:hypothetical protein [Candidatus Pacearchaeota archaeon]
MKEYARAVKGFKKFQGKGGKMARKQTKLEKVLEQERIYQSKTRVYHCINGHETIARPGGPPPLFCKCGSMIKGVLA